MLSSLFLGINKVLPKYSCTYHGDHIGISCWCPFASCPSSTWCLCGPVFPLFLSVPAADWTGKDLLRLQICLVGTLFPLEQCINNLMGLFPAVVVEPIFVPISRWSNIFRSFFETICIRVYLSLTPDLSLVFFCIAPLRSESEAVWVQPFDRFDSGCDREPWTLRASHGCLNYPSWWKWTHDQLLYLVRPVSKKVPDTSVAVHCPPLA